MVVRRFLVCMTLAPVPGGFHDDQWEERMPGPRQRYLKLEIPHPDLVLWGAPSWVRERNDATWYVTEADAVAALLQVEEEEEEDALRSQVTSVLVRQRTMKRRSWFLPVTVVATAGAA